jgi:hypothetical protein
MKTFLVVQNVDFVFKVEANDEAEARELASQLDYDSAYETYADPAVQCEQLVLFPS